MPNSRNLAATLFITTISFGLALKGAIVQVGTMGEGTAPIALGKLMMKRARLIGTVLRARPLEEKAALAQRFTRELVPAFAAGRLHPVIDRRYPLEEIAAGIRAFPSG